MSVVLFTLAVAVQTPDTSTYRNVATAALLDQARQRHEYQDRLVRDYTALVRTRLDVGFGRRRFARIPPVVAHETAARITWSLPNDLKVDILGERLATVFSDSEIESAFDRPWFIPRSLGDSIRLVDDDLPATAALHPLADGAERFYRYAIVDSLTMSIPGRTVRAVAVRVTPKQLGASLIAGDLWLDAETAEVVRLMFVFVGEYLWEAPDGESARDSADARRDNVWAQRIVKMEADLEYALYDARYWMPFRQLVQLSIDIPWLLNVAIPVRFLTTFDEYEVNTAVTPQFAADSIPDEAVRADRRRRREVTRCPDGQTECDRDRTGYFKAGTAEGGGRWEVHYPPRDSINQFAWPDELSLSLDAEDEDRIKDALASLGELQEQLPADWVGRMGTGVAFENLSDLYRFNRVQGGSVGGGYQFRPGPDFTTIFVTARFGLADRRPVGSVTWRRDAPDGRLDLTLLRDVKEVEPWTAGLGFGNTMNAGFAAHDDADYYLALGGGLRYESNGGGVWRDVTAEVGFQRQRSMRTTARSGLNDALGGDGVFAINPAVAEGDFLRVALSRRSRFGRVVFDHGVEALKQLGDDRGGVRLWGAVDIPATLVGRRITGSVRGGSMFGDDLSQLLYRVGGPATVRGYEYGYRRGTRFWSVQLDAAMRSGGFWTPVVFVDAGNVGDPAPGLSAVGDGPLVAVGSGISFLDGLVRFNLAKGLSPGRDVRFDLLFRAPR